MPATQAAPLTVPSERWNSQSFARRPFRPANVPVPPAMPRPKKERTTVPSVFVNEHVLPVRLDDTALPGVPVTFRVAVAGAHASVPLSKVLLVAADQFVVRLAVKVPLSSREPFVTEPVALAVVPLKLEPVPLSFANTPRLWWYGKPPGASAVVGATSAAPAMRLIRTLFMLMSYPSVCDP